MRPPTMPRLRPPRTRHAQRGVAAVEFGLLLTLLVSLLMAASEFGRAMVQYDTLVKSARSASRYLSQWPAGDPVAIAAAKNLVVYGSTTPTGAALVPGLTTAMVSVCDASNCAASSARQFTGQTRVNLVSVTVSGLRFESLASWLLPNFVFAPIVATMTQGVS